MSEELDESRAFFEGTVGAQDGKQASASIGLHSWLLYNHLALRGDLYTLFRTRYIGPPLPPNYIGPSRRLHDPLIIFLPFRLIRPWNMLVLLVLWKLLVPTGYPTATSVRSTNL